MLCDQRSMLCKALTFIFLALSFSTSLLLLAIRLVFFHVRLRAAIARYLRSLIIKDFFFQVRTDLEGCLSRNQQPVSMRSHSTCFVDSLMVNVDGYLCDGLLACHTGAQLFIRSPCSFITQAEMQHPLPSTHIPVYKLKIINDRMPTRKLFR